MLKYNKLNAYLLSGSQELTNLDPKGSEFIRTHKLGLINNPKFKRTPKLGHEDPRSN